MFLRSYKRKKNGKWHEYFSVVENRRVANGKTVQRTVLYLGEITSSQENTWRKTLEVFDKLSAIMMIDVRIPTTDGRMLEMRRYSQPEIEQRIILDKLKVKLPKQPPPKVYSHQLSAQLCGGN